MQKTAIGTLEARLETSLGSPLEDGNRIYVHGPTAGEGFVFQQCGGFVAADDDVPAPAAADAGDEGW